MTTSNVLIWAAAGIGILVRILAYLMNRAVWYDEAMLALNIIRRSTSGLWAPLDYQQAAPVGFLMNEKLSVHMFGDSEYALRLLPFFFGILSLIVFTVLAKELLQGYPAAIAVLVFALSPYLVNYAAEAKQYESDVFGAVTVLLLGWWVMRNESRLLPLTAWALFGAVWIWFSHPVVFILAGTWIQVIIFAVGRENRRLAVRAFVVECIWLISFGLSYLRLLKPLTTNAYLLDYWKNGFPTQQLPLWPFHALLWAFDNPGSFQLSWLSASPLALLLLLTGIVAMWKRHRTLYWSMTTPFLFVLFAATAQKYPFQGRLILFLVPLMILMIGFGLEEIGRLRIGLRIPLAAVSAAALAFPVVGIVKVVRPSQRLSAGIRPAIQYVASHRGLAGVTIYGEDHSIEYYSYRNKLTVLQKSIAAPYSDAPATDNGGRWYIFVDVAPEAVASLVAKLNRQGVIAERLSFGAIQVLRYIPSLSRTA